jgi:uncharacterized membrane protein YphA (DoxX/SURF4 family)
MQPAVHWFERLLERARRTRWANLFVVNLRIFLGYAFVPAGLKKLLDEPFTDPAKRGAFHEFLHAFYASGYFYQFVGVMQLTAAVLLMTQRFATVGALIALPMFGTITVFCWSTRAYFTAVMVTLMLLGIIGLLLWDFHKWRAVLASDRRGTQVDLPPLPPVVDLGLWQRCGLAVLAVYLTVCALDGGIYRPKGVELDTPQFWLFPAMLLIPIVTFIIDQARYRRATRGRR